MRWPALLSALLVLSLLPAAAAEPVVRLVEFETTVNPVTAKRITRSIDEAEAAGEDLVLIRLDTPGGLVTSMETIIKRMLASEVPVAAWVGPSGAKAASAGFVILISADVAAMAPGTRTGAASTVMLGGDNKEGDVLLKKSNEDMAAFVRSVAQRRGRDIGASEDAVFAAKAYEETVALEKGLVENARKIGQTARTLFERVCTFADHLGRMGDNLRKATEAYNSAAASWESRVLPMGRRISDLGITARRDDFAELMRLDADPRVLPPTEQPRNLERSSRPGE